MKEIFISLFFAISSFFGFKNQEPQDISPTIPVIIETPTIVSVEPTNIPTLIPTRKPTAIPKPTTSVTEEVLKLFFQITNTNQVNFILTNKEELTRYEINYYSKHKNFPIPRLSVDLNKLYGLPSKNGLVICKGTQLTDLYGELTKFEEDLAYKKMDYDCHYNNSKKETQECQDWRRDHDQNRQADANNEIETLQKQINQYIEEKKKLDILWDTLLEKYCK